MLSKITPVAAPSSGGCPEIVDSRAVAEPTSTLKGALDKQALRDRYAMCGTAAPDAERFERVICAAEHSWRAIQVVPYEPARTYPGGKPRHQAVGVRSQRPDHHRVRTGMAHPLMLRANRRIPARFMEPASAADAAAALRTALR